MAITWLKRGKPEAERAADDAQVRATVESVLADISARGDAAVRLQSERRHDHGGNFPRAVAVSRSRRFGRRQPQRMTFPKRFPHFAMTEHHQRPDSAQQAQQNTGEA